MPESMNGKENWSALRAQKKGGYVRVWVFAHEEISFAFIIVITHAQTLEFFGGKLRIFLRSRKLKRQPRWRN